MASFINLKFDKKEAVKWIPRFVGICLFSEKSEKEAIELLIEEREYSMEEVLGALIISGIKNFDAFDMNELCKAANCSLEDVKNIFNKNFIKKYLPIKFKKNYVNKNIERIQNEIKKWEQSQDYNENIVRKRKKHFEDVIKRFGEWVEEGRIIIKS